MAEAKKRTGGGSGSTKRSAKRTTKAAGKESLPEDRSPSGGDSDGDGNMPKSQEAQTGGKSMGRPPADEPDVYVYVPKVKVGELCIDVERLDAHLALRAQVANLVNLVAGVHVSVDQVKIDLKDVDAECELKVRLENTYNILDRTLTTLDENPEVVEKLLDTADSAVQETGQIGRQATKPGGAVSELGGSVGDSLGSLGDSLSGVTKKANPKKLASGGSSLPPPVNGSGAARTAAKVGAVGLVGLAGAALVDGALKRRRSPLEKAMDRVGM